MAKPANMHANEPVKLVVSDLDGTLLDPDGKVPAEFWELQRQLHEQGITFAAASGRQLPALEKLFAQAFDPVFIADNGAYASIDGKVLAALPIPLNDARAITTRLRAIQSKEPFGIIWSCPKAAYIDPFSDPVQEIARRDHLAMERINDLTSVPEAPLRISILAPTGTSDELFSAVQSAATDYAVMRSTPIWTDIANPTANKGAALAAVQEALGVTLEETIVFGDYPNDLPMFPYAGTACAMAGAHPDVLAAADEVIGSNADHGVLRRLRQILDELA